MIRGIARTVAISDLVPGAFYLHPRYDEAPDLIQVVRLTAQSDDDSDTLHALLFDPAGSPPLLVTDLDRQSNFVLMPDVSIRIDPPSVGGQATTTGLRAGMFFVSEDVPFVVATIWNRGYYIVNLATGTIENRNFHREPWVVFTRWQLLVDENGEEVPIASFGDDPTGS